MNKLVSIKIKELPKRCFLGPKPLSKSQRHLQAIATNIANPYPNLVGLLLFFLIEQQSESILIQRKLDFQIDETL